MPDVALLVIELLFGILFAWSLWTAVRGRDRLARDVTLVFTPIAAVLAVQLAGQVVGPLPAWLRTTSTLLLFVQPIFTLKLVSDIRAVPRWLVPAAVGAFTLTTALLLVSTTMRATWGVLPAVALFVGAEGLAAAYLVLEAQRRSGAARLRLAIAALATAAIALVLLVVGAAALVSAPSDVSGVAIRALALVAAVGYWVAFLPPRRLRHLWLASAAFAHTQRQFAAPASATSNDLWSGLARASRELTGAAAVVLSIDGSELRVVAAEPPDLALPDTYPVDALDGLVPGRGADPIVADLATRTGHTFIKIVPIVRDGRPSGAVCLLRRHASLFDADDVDLVSLLATRSDALVQRREVLAQEEQLSERLRVTVAALEAAGAAKSDFLASMSHELRTPLNAIIGFSELMVADANGADTVTVPREWVDHIRNGGRHLVALINDVLDLSKVEAGRLDLAKVPVELGHAVAESVAGLHPLADRKRQRVEVSIDPIVVDADPGRLRQILYNLLSNAIKYTPDEGRIRITAARYGDEVRVAVEDTGIGIAPDDQMHVFEEFRQVGDPTTHQTGTGLGLALTKRLVHAHGGRLELRSAPGAGSTFTFTLPIGAPSPSVDAVLPTHTNGSGSGGTVLIIEDDPSSVRLLQTYLADTGYRLVIAPDGERGLQLALEDPPAAILLDVLLPAMDGWEVLRRLKSEPKIRDVPVVIVTVVDERNVGLALGAVDYFVKPVERDALLARLDRHTFTTKVRSRSMTVLAIDDDIASLDMIEATLHPLGFAVHRADSGSIGLQLAPAVRPDLVICDLMMPGVDGFEVVAQLHANPATATIPILILTAHELTDSDKARLNGRILGVIDKGDAAATGLREWLSRVIPEMPAPAEA